MPRILKAGTWIQPTNIERNNYNLSEDALLISKSERERYKKIKEAEQFNAFVRHHSREHGGFTFINSLVDLTTNDPATIGRLAFLSTYLDFNTQVLYKGQKYPMQRSDLATVLHISKPTATTFYNDAVSSGLLLDCGSDGLCFSKIFFRGSIDRDSRQTRLYIKTVRNLYHRMKSNQHHRFGYIVQLIPFINREWNVVCDNPEEVDSQLIQPLSMKQICGKLHLNADHSNRLQKAITSPIFEFDGEEQQLCAIVPTTTSRGRQNTLYINPHLIYGGSDFVKVEGISIAFRSNAKG